MLRGAVFCLVGLALTYLFFSPASVTVTLVHHVPGIQPSPLLAYFCNPRKPTWTNGTKANLLWYRREVEDGKTTVAFASLIGKGMI